MADDKGNYEKINLRQIIFQFCQLVFRALEFNSSVFRLLQSLLTFEFENPDLFKSFGC
jgi:hypothetical protein